MALLHSVRVRLGAVRRQIGWRGDVDERLLWIFGSPRSGSTWLLRMLTEHERIVPVNEPLIGVHLGLMLPDAVDLEVDLEALDSEGFMVRQLRADNPDDFFAAEFRDVWLPALGELLRKRFAAHAQRYPRNPLDAVLAIQEPNGSQSADLIMGAFPRSRFVFLLRDGRDVVDSILAASQPDTWATRSFRGARRDRRHRAPEADRAARARSGSGERRSSSVRSPHTGARNTGCATRTSAPIPRASCGACSTRSASAWMIRSSRR